MKSTKGHYNSVSELDTAQRVLSVAGGATLLTSALKGLNKPSFGSLLSALAGGYLVYRGVSGECPLTEAVAGRKRGLSIYEVMTVNRPRNEVYATWRKLSNLSKFMKHIKQVDEVNRVLSRWKAEIPGGFGTIEWNAQILLDHPDEKIVWQSVEEAEIENSGEVIFKDAPGGRGTEVHATITYRPPIGILGAAVARVFNDAFELVIREDLRSFKRMLETGEIITIEGQPAARSTSSYF